MITGESPALFGEDSGLFEEEENEKTGESTGGPRARAELIYEWHMQEYIRYY